MALKQLTPQEKAVIVDKGTERPFSGQYCDHHENGNYNCRRCGMALFSSSTKFDSRCGWPSFDEALTDAVRQAPDADGMRTEILCSHCGAHLGHIFYGEGITAKNTRHCVNSISLDFSHVSDDSKLQKAVFAAGCFWGMEHYFKKTKGVISTRVGYTGGEFEYPVYKQVCAGNTGHAEAVEVTFDLAQTSYEDMAKLFFEIHDPAQIDRQGPDIGNQYRSAVFYTDDHQRRIALALIDDLKLRGHKVATQVIQLGQFWEAEDYHQNYYAKTNTLPYCHRYTKRF